MLTSLSDTTKNAKGFKIKSALVIFSHKRSFEAFLQIKLHLAKSILKLCKSSNFVNYVEVVVAQVVDRVRFLRWT